MGLVPNPILYSEYSKTEPVQYGSFIGQAISCREPTMSCREPTMFLYDVLTFCILGGREVYQTIRPQAF